VYLPASLEAPVRRVAAAGAKPSRGRGETILLVEDARSVRHATASVLRQLGYRVVEAGNSQEALTLWQEEREKVDLLLTDMVMPGEMNGQELAERLRLDRPSLKCLLVSGYSRDLVDQNAPLQQGVAFLAKPLDPVLVAERIRACLDVT
jgi:CheY-like chemotaxis protein